MRVKKEKEKRMHYCTKLCLELEDMILDKSLIKTYLQL